MKAHLLYENREFGWRAPLQAAALRELARSGRSVRDQNFDRRAGLPWNADALTADLALDALFDAMAQGDDHILEVVRRVVLAGVDGDLATIRYRQRVLQDCLNHPAAVRELYAVAVEAMEERKRHQLGSFFAKYPDAVLRHGVELMSILLGVLKKLRRIADDHGGKFTAPGWIALFATVQRDLDDAYLRAARRHCERLKMRDGVLMTAALGKGNRGRDYVLRGLPVRRGTWREALRNALDALIGRLLRRGETCPAWLRPKHSPVYSFSLHPRDEAGARALAELRNRGIALVADALGQSADHVGDFFAMLRAELGFYVGCINLHERLGRAGVPLCLPVPAPAAERQMSCRGLYDVCLALTLGREIVGNDVAGDGKSLVIVTGANQGGKSTFLRSVGLAQLMMQAGMFVPAEAFRAALCDGLFTHCKRPEDSGMKSGKLDEELRRMSEIVDHVVPHSLILFNESFAATNEREGSEIARQIMTALAERRVKIVCVTHLYELARGFCERNEGDVLFLRAERARSFKLREAEPLPTSFGADLYDAIFAGDSGRVEPENPALNAAAP